MSDPYVGEIRSFAGNFAPRGWALCNGQLLPISQNTALFSLLGTMYGGDGKTNFALPDLMGRTPMQQGTGAGLSPRYQGEAGGEATVTLTVNEMPMHRHIPAAAATGTSGSPEGAIWAGVVPGRSTSPVYGPATGVQMSSQAVTPTGGGASHNNRQPYLGVTYIIALSGEFPSRG